MFSLQSTMPVFLVMVLGYILGRMKFLNESFCKTADKLVFKAALPVMLFLDMSAIDLKRDFDLKYVLFCAAATTTAFLLVWLAGQLFLKDKSSVGEFVQASYRSSAAILGAAFISNMYGNSGMAPLMMIGSVPLFNVYAVLILTLTSPEPAEAGVKNSGGEHADDTLAAAQCSLQNRPFAYILKKVLPKTLKGIVTNPIIIGIFAGLVFNLLPVTMPSIPQKTLSGIAQLATPLALLSIGASFEGAAAIKELKPAIAASAFKLVILVAIFIPIAIWLGFTGQKLVALLIMLGSPATPTCYVMAKNMGHKGVISSSCVALTTLLSAFTITFWLYVLKSLELISAAG